MKSNKTMKRTYLDRQVKKKPAEVKLNLENVNVEQLQESNDKDMTDGKLVKKKVRGIIDVESMKREMIQLEDNPVTILEKTLTKNRLKYDFFNIPSEELAQNLLGKILVRLLDNGRVLKGRVVETESYLGGIDKASITYQYRVTAHNLPLYMSAGTIYVYLTYGMYCCFNISSQGEGSGVLLRALEPLEGLDEMLTNRTTKKSKNPDKVKNFKTHELTNGPSKLCMAMKIDRDHCKYSMCTWKRMWIENDANQSKEEIKIVKCPRIGIDRAGAEWANKPMRFYIYGNTSVSKRDKKAEERLISGD